MHSESAATSGDTWIPRGTSCRLIEIDIDIGSIRRRIRDTWKVGPGWQDGHTLLIDRKKPRGSVIFNNPKKRKIVNEIVHPHPAVHHLWGVLEAWLGGDKLLMVDVPLLIEIDVATLPRITLADLAPLDPAGDS